MSAEFFFDNDPPFKLIQDTFNHFWVRTNLRNSFNSLVLMLQFMESILINICIYRQNHRNKEVTKRAKQIRLEEKH